MKKIISVILTLFLIFINISANAAQNVVKKDIKVVAKDGFSIKAELTTPKIKGVNDFKTVVLLHSLGYNSGWWGNLPDKLIQKGYAVLKIDLRGHGGSVYNKNLAKVSWKSMTKTAYSKCPDDITAVINSIIDDSLKKHYFREWAIVGSDMGASVGVIAADRLPVKPKTIVMISPVVNARGLYVPVSVAQLDNVDFLAIIGANDEVSKSASAYIKKFAQAGYDEYISPSQTSGMLILKNDPELTEIIAEWIENYFKD